MHENDEETDLDAESFWTCPLWDGADWADDEEMPALDSFSARIKEIVDRACATEPVSPEEDATLLALHLGEIADPYQANDLCDRIRASVPLRRRFGELVNLIYDLQDVAPVGPNEVPEALWRSLANERRYP